MAIPLHRIRPSRATVAVAAGLLWAFSFGAVREFVWADLRAGMIDLRGFRRSTRALVWAGFALLAATLLALLSNGLWRSSSPLVALESSLNTVGRGSMVPLALIPATLYLVATAWAFALTGALHARPRIRVGMVALYLVCAGGWVNSDTSLATYLGGFGTARDLLPLVAGWLLLAAVPGFFLLRARREARPVPEFLVLFSLVSAVFLAAQTRHMEAWTALGMPVLMGMLEMNVTALQGLVMPLLLLIGVEVAILTHRLSGWTTAVVAASPARWLPGTVLAAALALRLYQGMGELRGQLALEGAATTLRSYAGALAVPIATFLVWWLVAGRRSGADEAAPTPEAAVEAAERHGPRLILLFIGVQLVGTALLLTTQALPMLPLVAAVQAMAQALFTLMNGTLTTPWHLLVNVGALVVAARMARRGRRAAALYLGIFGVLHLWFELTSPGRLLAPFGWRGAAPEELWWMVLFTGAALLWLARGRLTGDRAALLLGLVVMTWLLRQASFLDDPYSPLFFGYSGIGLVAFGILWDVVSAGSWANRDTDGLPRTGRVLMYVGYVLLTATVVNWAVTSHDLDTVSRFTGDTAMVGLERFGRPLVYAIIALTLAAPPPPARVEEPASRM